MCTVTFEELSLKEKKKAVIAKFSGSLPQGSASNKIVEMWKKQINQALEANIKNKVLILDFTKLRYVYSDSFGTLWIEPLSREVQCILIATASTRKAIEGLTAISLPVEIVGTLEEALKMIPRSPLKENPK